VLAGDICIQAMNLWKIAGFPADALSFHP
jgi:hypothetical protein